MTSKTALATLDLLWEALSPLGHPMAVMGGISLAAWNYIRATRDVDMLIGIDAPNVTPVLTALAPLGFRPKKSSALVTVGEHHFVQLLYTPPGEFYDVQFDFLLAESELQQSAIRRRVRRQVRGLRHALDVLHCDDLILLKLIAGRLIDRADIVMLLRENRDAIDLDYLRGWLTKLHLTTDFAALWAEAFAGEQSPIA